MSKLRSRLQEASEKTTERTGSYSEVDESLFTAQIEPVDSARAKALEAQVEELQTQLQTVQSGGVITIGRCTLSRVGLNMPDDLNLSEWLEIGQNLKHLEGALQWMIGDWAIRGEQNYNLWIDGSQSDKSSRNQRYKLLAEITEYEHGTIKNLASTARNIPFDERRSSVPYSKHIAVQSLPIAKMRELLDHAENNPDESVRDFRERVKRLLGHSKPNPLPLAKDNRIKSWNKIKSAITVGEKPTLEDIEIIESWLNDLKNSL